MQNDSTEEKTFNTQWLNCNWQEYYNTCSFEQKWILIDSLTVLGYVTPVRFKINKHDIYQSYWKIQAWCISTSRKILKQLIRFANHSQN